MVGRIEPRFVEFAGVHFYAHLFRRELPGQLAVDVADELHRDPTRFIRNISTAVDRLVGRVLHARSEISVVARDAIDRHARESEQEHAGTHQRGALDELSAALFGRLFHQRKIEFRQNPTKIANATNANIHTVRRTPARRAAGSNLSCVIAMLIAQRRRAPGLHHE